MSRGAAIVTGAPRRIGRALALAAADCGYDVLVHHRSSPADAGALVDDLTSKGVSACTFAADLADPAAPATIVKHAGEALGAVTLLINNASLFEDDRLGDLDAGLWDRHMAVNLRAPVLLTQAFAKALPKDRHGLVVNILDQRVWRPTPLFFSYALAKSALWTATRMSAQALAPRIRVNGIGPGPTLASTHQSQAEFEAEAKATPLGEPVRPEDIAGALRYLIEAPRVTGQMIAVDAGQHLAWRTPDINAS
jgi:NAD(P)-dependent dehydrogenase (short-subunit alcohol dehydrogenase family)